MKKHFSQKSIGAKFLSVLLAVALTVTSVVTGNITIYAEENDETTYDSDLYVDSIEGLSEDFIMGVDISSVISLENSGVVWTDQDGNEQDFFEILADSGVNWVRVRIWNDPYYTDSEGNKYGYGGGNNDLDYAIKIGKRATAAGLKVLLDFHYSDFWAHPGVQTLPKAWSGYTVSERTEAIYDYTLDSLNEMKDEGVDVGMVQIGNETTSAFCGSSSWSEMTTMFKAGCQAIDDFNDENGTEILKAIHFTNPNRTSTIKSMADYLDRYDVDYDVFATSYYPFWHGTLSNLLEVLNYVADTYDKYTMVAEFSWANTTSDADNHGNNVSSASVLSKYDISQQGQAIAIHDIVETVNNVNDGKGLGIFYWEPAWIKSGLGECTKRSDAWNLYGSGWASQYAQYYTGYANLSDVTDYWGGSSWDNMALFSQTGQALEVLNTFKYLYKGTNATLTVSEYDDPSFSMELNEALVMPSTISVTYTIKLTRDENVTWDAESLLQVNTSVEGDYVVTGHLTDYPDIEVECTVTVYENTITSVEDTVIAVSIGESVTYPTTVSTTYKNGSAGTATVTWNEEDIALVDTDTEGVYEVSGILDDYEGFTAKLSVVVCEGNLAENGNFETSDVSSGKSRNVPSWTTYASVATSSTWPVYTETKSSYPQGAGSRCITFWTSSYNNYSAKFYQTIDISDYGAGYYLVSIYAMTDISQGLYLYATSGDENAEITAQKQIAVSSSYAKNSMIVSVTDAKQLTVGVYDDSIASGAWANMDKFEVCYIGIDENAEISTSINYYYDGNYAPAVVYENQLDGVEVDFMINGMYGYYMEESQENAGWYSFDVSTTDGDFYIYEITDFYAASNTADGRKIFDTTDDDNYNNIMFKGLNYIYEGNFFKSFEAAVGEADYEIECSEAQNGEITTDVATAKYKDTVTVNATADTGYELSKVYVNGTAIEGTSFEMPAMDVTITADFSKINYTITIADDDRGTLTAVSTANYKDIVEVSAEPALGYTLNKLYLNGVEIEGTSFEMPAEDVEISADFEYILYSITEEDVTGAKIEAAYEEASIGTLLSFTVTAEDGYEIVSDSIKVYDSSNNEVEIVANGSTYTFSMPADDVVITCETNAIDYEITYKSVTGGNIEADRTTANVGDVITITATADDGYYLSEVKVRYKTKLVYIETTKIDANTYSFVMEASNVQIIPTFSLKEQNSISISWSVGGTATLSSSLAYTTDIVTVFVNPDLDYKLKEISVSTENAGGVLDGDTFEMPNEAVSVYVEFELKPWTLTTEEASNGVIILDKDEAVLGEEVTVTAAPSTGYKLDTVYVNGKAIEGVSFEVPSGGAKVSAVFVPDSEQKFDTVLATDMENGSIALDSESFSVESIVNVIVTPNAGYELDTIYVNGEAIEGTSFIMPAGSVTITATFKAVQSDEDSKDDESKDESKDETAADESAGNDSSNGTSKDETSKAVAMKKGTKFVYKSLKYKVIKSTSTKRYIAVIGVKSKNIKKAVIPAQIKINGFTYKVTQIAKGAFRNCKKLKSVTISKNIKKIGAKAFYGCKNLKLITVKSKVIKTIGKKAFTKVKSNVKVKIKKSVFKKYKKLMLKRGIKNTAKFKKF